MLDRSAEVRDIAKALAREAAAVTPAMLLLAQATLEQGNRRVPFPDASSQPEFIRRSRASVREVRARLLRDPRDAIALVDLARHYSNLGMREKSLAAMSRALALAPDSRMVLRAATRLFVHASDAERALHVLRRSFRTKEDPWLIACELAAAEVAGKSSKLAKTARQILANKRFSPSQVTELESALATLELGNGKAKVARRLFQDSLITPTDNSVAQAEWASKHLQSLFIDNKLLDLERTYEARARVAFYAEDFDQALKHGIAWLFDEPFSSRPARFSSSIAAVAMNDYKRSAEIARAGLAANPADQALRNNLVFALAMDWNIKDAETEFAEVVPPTEDILKVALTATGGLLHYRKGNISAGRLEYQRARDLARTTNHPKLEAEVVTNWVREEHLAKGDRARELVTDARALLNKFPEEGLMKVMARSIERIDEDQVKLGR